MAKPMKPGVLYAYNSENKTFKEVKVAKGNPGKGTKGYQYGDPGPCGVNDHSAQCLPNKKTVRGA